METNPYAGLLGGGGGGGGGSDKATSSASSSTSGNQFGSIGGGDGNVGALPIVGAVGVFILGLVALVWAISRGR